MAIRKSSSSGIPFGNTAGRPANPAVGQPYFNGQENRLEIYTQSVGWQNIVAETPGVVSYTGSVLESNSTNTLVISGTNFTVGAIASLIGNDGTEYIANTTTVNSIVQITAVFGALAANKEPYDIKVVNPSNLYGILPDTVSVNDSPVWTTAAGSLGTFNGTNSISVTVAASDEENNTITYSSSTLPEWLSINSSTGVVSGTAINPSATTTYSFTIDASDGINTAQSRAFSVTVNPVTTVTGGTLTSDSTYYYRTFTGNGTFAVSNGSLTADIMIVAGGGPGGGNLGGGGGAGGYKYLTSYSIPSASHSITIGGGGARATGSQTGGRGSNGISTQFGSIYTCTGGGAGGSGEPGSEFNGNSGGSGGGSTGYTASVTRATGVSGEGNSGGVGGKGGDNYPGGGGGGSGAQGGDSASSASKGGAGGIGTSNNIIGTTYYWAAGGGGGSYSGTAGGGDGGLGGGGGGGTNNATAAVGSAGGSALNAAESGFRQTSQGSGGRGGGDAGINTGSGGGGAPHVGYTSGAGGSGIVVVRYTKNQVGG